MTFEKLFPFLTWPEAHKNTKFVYFSDKQCPFAQNLFFTPRNTPPNVKNSKPI